jgi:thymidylate kinase
VRHVVVEGLPAVGKTEALALLARFYPQSVRVLPELVKEVVEAEGIDLFRERDRLTDALRRAIPDRARHIREILAAGYSCLEESHLGVHRAYSRTLGDSSFVRAYDDLEARLPKPDLYVRLDLPIEESIARQAARGTPQYAVDAPQLK